jgi:LuxR family maltose regulon positive regulatory protein
MGIKLSTEDITALEARTEGWIAGLQMAALSMQGRHDLTSFIQSFTGSHVYIAEYLVDEVLRQQPEEIQTFLQRTSILEQLCEELCEAVTGIVGTRGLLSALFKANLFVIPLDDTHQWFRYHQLFSDLLRAHLKQTEAGQTIAELHKRAANWYEKEGMPSQAIEHALLSADYQHVLCLVEKMPSDDHEAYFKTVNWLQAIPPEYLKRKSGQTWRLHGCI